MMPTSNYYIGSSTCITTSMYRVGIEYNSLLKLHMDNVYTSSWIKPIENLLSECNIQIVWEEQFYGQWIRNLKDNFIEKWRMEISDMSQCYLYKYYKTELSLKTTWYNLIHKVAK